MRHDGGNFGLLTPASWGAAIVLVAAILVAMPTSQDVAAATPLPPTEVTLGTDKLAFDAGSSFTLTATVDQPLEDTSSTLEIFDETNTGIVKTCTSGLTCSVNLSFNSGPPREYIARVSALESTPVEVGRTPWTVTLTTTDAALEPGETALLVATTNQSLSATNGTYSTVIFDLIRGTRVRTCTTGTTCSLTVAPFADLQGPGDYIAVVMSATDTTADSPVGATDVQAASDTVPVDRAIWELEMTSSSDELLPGEDATLSVTSPHDMSVANSLFSIYIYEMGKDELIAQCDSGSTCSGDTEWEQAEPYGGYYMAYVAEKLSTPPSSFNEINQTIVGASSMVQINVPVWQSSIGTSSTVLEAGQSATITASVNMDPADTSGRYAYYIVDWVSGAIVKTCAAGTSCEYVSSFWGAGDDGYAARVYATIVGAAGASGSWDQIQEWRTASDSVRVDRQVWWSTLEQTGPRSFTLSTNQNSGYTNSQWAWYLFNSETGQREAVCTAGLRCVLKATTVSATGYAVLLARRNNPSNISAADDVITGAGVYYPPAAPAGPELSAARRGGTKESTGGRNKAGKPCVCGRADPVNTATGEFYLPETDLGIDGVGPTVSVSRTYAVSGIQVEGPFGLGWSANFDMSLTPVIDSDDSNPLPRQVEVVQENGATLLFTRDGSSSEYFAAARVYATLTYDAGTSTWELIRKFNEVLHFDAAGQLVALYDRLGNGLTFSYTSGDLTQISGSGGRSIVLTWSGDRVASLEDSAGRTVEYEYDLDGDLVEVTAPDRSTTTYEYDSSHRMTALILAGGRRTENVYDSENRVVLQTDPIGRETVFEYLPWENSTAVTNPAGYRTVDVYSRGLLVSQTEAEGTPDEATTYYSYDSGSNVSAIVDPLGEITVFTYDEHGNRLTQTDALGAVTTWTYDDHGNPLTREDPLGRVTTTTYDASGYPIETVGELGITEEWTYNTDGTLGTSTDAEGGVTEYDYDAAGRLVLTTDAEDRETEIEYDGAGMPIRVTTPDGESAVTVYDDAGRGVCCTGR